MQTSVKHILFLVLFFIISFESNSKTLRFETISQEDGLSQSVIKVIHKDRNGFMWIGTEDGLNKYDGYTFQIYKHDPFDSTSISNNNILSIVENKEGDLWIGTNNGGLVYFDRETEKFKNYLPVNGFANTPRSRQIQRLHLDSQGDLWMIYGESTGGVDRFDPKAETFYHYTHRSHDPKSLSDDRIRDLYEDQQGTIWIATVRGLNRYDRQNNHFERFMHEPGNPNSLSYNEIISIRDFESEPDILWLGTGNHPDYSEGGGLIRLNKRTLKFKHYCHDPSDPNSINSDVVSMVSRGGENSLWVATRRGFDRLDLETEKFVHYLPDPENPDAPINGIRTFIRDRKCNFWMIPLDYIGLLHFDPAKELFTHFTHDPDFYWSLSNNLVQTIYYDSSGILWVGTNGGALNKVDLFSCKFQTISYEPNNTNSLSGNMVRAIYQDHNDELWVGLSGGGLNRFNPSQSRVRHYRYDPDNHASISSNSVWVVFEDRNNVIWVGTYGGGLNRFNRDRETFTRFVHNPSDSTSLDDNRIRTIFQDEDGILWLGTETAGLVRFDRQKRRFKSYRISEQHDAGLGQNSVRAIVSAGSDGLWIGTFGGGLYLFDKKTASFKDFQHHPGDPNSLSNNQIQALYRDENGLLWIGTFGGGLNCFDPESHSFIYFSEQNSDLPNNVVYGILEDDHQNLWLSTNRGIAKFDKISRVFRTYDVDDGLQSKEFNGQAFHRNDSGEMFFGGINGLNIFHPDSIEDNPHIPQVAITDFRLFQKPVKIGPHSPLKKHITETQEIRLDHDQNDIAFDFVVLHYNQPDKNQYAYMLENYDDDWRLAGTQRSATYTNLDPGMYTFHVKGTNNDGVWNHDATSVRIIIDPPWWLRGWAFAGYVLFFSFAVYGVHRFQRQRVINMEREKAQTREATLRAQAAEAEARAIRAESARKTQELEEARALQLSMLPKKVPQIENLDIAVHMQTATEVGGDYYDFRLDKENHLMVVIGDATGHGLNAGMMVSVIKSLFIANTFNSDQKSFLQKCSHTIRQLQLGNLYMAMTLLKIVDHQMVVSAGGMPPVYVYRAGEKKIEEVLIKAMPLGAVSHYSYEERRVELQPGDTLLLLTDGLPEMFNQRKELFDYHRVKNTFFQVADLPAQNIVDALVDVGRQWRPAENPNDDVTFVVIKVKS